MTKLKHIPLLLTVILLTLWIIIGLPVIASVKLLGGNEPFNNITHAFDKIIGCEGWRDCIDES